MPSWHWYHRGCSAFPQGGTAQLDLTDVGNLVDFVADGEVRGPARRLANFVLAGAVLGDEIERSLAGAVVLQILYLLILVSHGGGLCDIDARAVTGVAGMSARLVSPVSRFVPSGVTFTDVFSAGKGPSLCGPQVSDASDLA